MLGGVGPALALVELGMLQKDHAHAVAPADETPTPSEQSTTSRKKSTPAGSAGDDTNGAASA